MAYTREEKAEALALLMTGVSGQRAAKELGLQPRTVQIWAKRFREISPEEIPQSIRDEDMRIVQRAQELIHEAFDEIEETGEARKYLIPLNAVKGTAQDKEHRSRETSGTNIKDLNVTIILGNPEPTGRIPGDVIEGEARIVEPPEAVPPVTD